MFPGAHVIGSVETNPQPWLTKDEWGHLLRVAQQRIDDAPSQRTRQQRQELRDFCDFMHATGLRVDEAYSLQVRDVALAYAKPVAAVPIDPVLARKMARSMARQPTAERGAKKRAPKRVPGEKWTMAVEVPYLKIRVRASKTGPRVCHSRLLLPIAAFQRLARDKAPADPLFRERHRDAFRELLIAADLRTNTHGHPRNPKCLRPTAISHWLIDRPTIPLSWLAANCGTSITMLQAFYIKRLGLGLDGTAWL
jgi:integrase